MSKIRFRFFLYALTALFLLLPASADPAPELLPQENTPLYFGNPSRARSDVSDKTNYLMEKKEYTLSYNDSAHEANWTAWHLDAGDTGKSGRGNTFRPDGTLPEGWYRVVQSDYQYVRFGFDRGHLCPSADRTVSVESNNETFLMTNMIPQAPDNNRIVWKALEDYERSLAESGEELYIFAGTYGTGGTSDKGTFTSIPIPLRAENGRPETGEDNKLAYSGMNISVPAYTWKIILALPEGENDIERVNKETMLLAVCIPNAQGCGRQGSWQQYVTTVDELESVTGYDFFDRLPDDTESFLEAKKCASSGE
jgi:DNA/RNA endonuclease G, NUC1